MIRINLTKRNIILFILGILILFLTIFSGTYAYLALRPTSSGSITDIDATGNDAAKDTLEFIGGTPITITPGAHNMSPVEGNLVSEVSNPKAVLTTIGLEATAVYNTYLFIDLNEYVYSTLEETPELILTIIDGEGNLVTNVEGLDYVSQYGVSGFDVTNKSGYYDIGETTISAGNNEVITHTWEVKLTLINLPTDQNINQNKVFESRVMMLQNKSFNKEILDNNGGIDSIESKTYPDFTQLALTDEGMYAYEDDYGTSYFFRGAVDNNWVYFAGCYWRIIRINGDESIRLIYSGTEAPTEEQKVNIPTGSVIGSAALSYWGYMFASSNFLANMHSNDLNSPIKIMNEEWYQGINSFSNVENKLIDYESYISDTLFCGDRTIATVANAYNWQYVNSSMDRDWKEEPFSLKCTDQRDAYTVEDTLKGNGALDYPVGMITYDELLLSVGRGHNTNNYLHSNQAYATMTASLKDTGTTYYYWGYATNSWTPSIGVNLTVIWTGSSVVNNGLRPVINIKSNVPNTGTGTWDDPYVILT